MKCPNCYAIETRVLSTRTADSGVVSRRRACPDCGHRFTTLELPPSAVSYARSDLDKWETRQIGEWKTKVLQRRKIAKLMCELKTRGVTCEKLAERFEMSVHMAYYYTSPKMMAKYAPATKIENARRTQPNSH